MINILEITQNPGSAISFYRSRLPLSRLRRSSCPVFLWQHKEDETNWEVLCKMDLVFVKSPYTQYHLDIIKMAKRLGIKIIIDIDDYIFEAPGYIKSAEEFNSPITHQRVLDCMWMADEVWVSTETLARNLQLKTGRDCVVIPNALCDLFFDKPRKFNPEYYGDVMYRGSYVHLADLNLFQNDLIEVVNENDCAITFLGQYPTFLKEFQFSKHIPFLPIDKYIEALSAVQVSINVVLLDTESRFSMCHSNNAWLEGTYAGAVTLAPDVPEWRRPGIVNYGDDFKEKLSAMIKGEYDLESLHQESWHYIEGHCKLEHTNKLREESIKRLLKFQ